MPYPRVCRFNSIAALLLIALLPLAALAQSSPAVVFQRTTVRIDPVAAQPKNLKAPRQPVMIDAEVRGEDALRLEYIHTLNTLGDTSGVMIVFNAPTLAALPKLHDYTPVDALFVSDDGTILQILPNVALANLESEVIAKQPVKAFLFLKSGAVAAHHILPHDVVAGSMFTPAPPVIQ